MAPCGIHTCCSSPELLMHVIDLVDGRRKHQSVQSLIEINLHALLVRVVQVLVNKPVRNFSFFSCVDSMQVCIHANV